MQPFFEPVIAVDGLVLRRHGIAKRVQQCIEWALHGRIEGAQVFGEVARHRSHCALLRQQLPGRQPRQAGQFLRHAGAKEHRQVGDGCGAADVRAVVRSLVEDQAVRVVHRQAARTEPVVFLPAPGALDRQLLRVGLELCALGTAADDGVLSPPALRGLAAMSLLLTVLNLPAAHAAQAADLFDFWLGDWSVSWTNANGSPGKARNRVTRSLDGKVIEELFEQDPADAPPLLRGRSISVLHQASGVWKQAWADNQGGFFALSASTDGDKRIFATELRRVGDTLTDQRMVFHSIQRDAFIWDWEGTGDGGQSWKLLWQLQYRR